MIYSLEGCGKRRFMDSCDIIEAIEYLKLAKKASYLSRFKGTIPDKIIKLLKVIREDLGVGNECVIESAVVMRRKGKR